MAHGLLPIFGRLDSAGQNRYKELDALRGVAALLVVFFHFSLFRPESEPVFKFGITGVDLFFMISGFVIFMSIQKVRRGIDFVINRVSRLYPTYWTAVLFMFVLLVISSFFREDINIPWVFVKTLANLTMFQLYLGIPDLDGPYWTMIIEMLFYISILLLFQLKWLRYIRLIGATVAAATVLFVTFFDDRELTITILEYFPLLQFVPLFLAGIVFYKIYTERTGLIVNYALLVFCLTCQLLLFSYAGRSRYFMTQEEYAVPLILYFVLFMMFINGKLRFIVNPVTLFLGKISFALYLMHQYLSVGIIIPFFHDKLGINFYVVAVFINLPIVIGIAAFVTYKIEMPWSKRMKGKLRSLAGNW